MFKYLSQMWQAKDLRDKIVFTIFMVVVYRLLTHVTMPGVDLKALQSVFDKNKILGAFSLLTGGSASNFSIMLMGLSPYINAVIIMQLLQVIIPKLEELSQEGEQGRQKITKYTRWLTFPLAFLQSYGMILLINSQANVAIIEGLGDPFVMLPIMLTVSAGTVILMWIGELITEKGITNGISILIFAGILSGLPGVAGQVLALASEDTSKLIPFVAGMLITVILTVLIIMITEGQRKIPVTYSGRSQSSRGEQANLPIRINQAGMIPIIFAISLITFPGVMAQFMISAESAWVVSLGEWMQTAFSVGQPLYMISYFLLIIAFTYFYVSITFNPDQIAETIQKRGGFIPGIRPGKQTAEYLHKVSNRLNLFGGVFIAFIAVSPIVIQQLASGTSSGSVPMLISGAGMIIVVGVVLELIRQVNAQLIMHNYEKFY
ncbi:preprotein translocase subunit SecY [Candidatus Peregrinibacteria bacterium CG22_combo_CG10-13_8_21_14_all_44_10]|nr:MAG: preprotein translocase subunit SecY [Candidatus Peregrinibacteria bacterium CG2_30_44_17]PIP66069.1 MAG: preprotein translocase subunit SecY [Candidatus Peregrinibacteria bacterium CG22_combo_CG10-13_8_21_14_all_44_10]PIS03615.1 MAG: preprotein translocase subunit SecY [Candidatus Peregrinibacteria bacterium CG10_big_fil_rev_8_21_14_0_10_44_7]PIX78877.1 MAG: preprotein translocase subunit SecY [Candidatus Peregrinibacteria bacterium CG_4_10_14_3_um_filter_44_21]PJB88872.1 MAG: preprotei